LALPLLYAATGVILGTLTGTVAGLISLQPGFESVSNHFSLASLCTSVFRPHPISNAIRKPVIENHGTIPSTAFVQGHTAGPVARLNLTAAAQTEPALETVSTDLGLRIANPSKSETTPVDGLPLIAKPAPGRLAHALSAPAIQPKPIRLLAVAPLAVAPLAVPATTAGISTEAKPPVVAESTLTDALSSPASPISSPLIPAPAAAAPLMFTPQKTAPLVYSEGDATVINYNASADTIQTDDGRTLVVGTSVSVSTALPWSDYHANVHYRCDQTGHCTLTRTGVIALNARLM
jgi:hypothetical protein